MDINNVKFFKDQVSEIPILNDEDFKNGKLNQQINSMSAVHYLIHPFLNVLGYNIFKHNEVSLNYTKEGKTADLAILENDSTLAVLKLLDLNENHFFENVKADFIENELSYFKVFNAPLVILTNGLEYVLYVFLKEKGEELLHFNLLKLDDNLSEFVYKVLHKTNLINYLTNNNFFSEKVIESNLGNLRNTEYLFNVIRKELSQPSIKFVHLISELVHKEYCNDLDINLLTSKLCEELLDINSGCLLNGIVKNDLIDSFNVDDSKSNETRFISSIDNTDEVSSVNVIENTDSSVDLLENSEFNSDLVDNKDNVEVKERNSVTDPYEDWTKPSVLGTSDNQFAEGEELNSILHRSSNNSEGRNTNDERIGKDLNSILGE